ncbi:HAAS signaling domain-containing protein [Nocardioides sp. GXQ0305]|uniref:HAAS signaling domain-containing protein n=1 Tax=Nocardioides sp. GXQ0305 TaxID=3423912 RepID=UPI003D7EBF7A
MTTTLTDPLVERYVAAVGSRLPADQRDDVADELRASILDQVEDRQAASPGADRETVVREVLTGLGDPAALSREYHAGPRYLVGPAFFDAWWQVLRTLLLIVPPIVGVASIAAGLWAGDQKTAAVVVDGVGTAFAVGVQITFWLTLVFWLLERSGAGAPGEGGGEPWTVDRLPALPKQRTLGVTELVSGLGLVLIVLLWFPWQQFRSPVDGVDGEPVPMLNPALWADWLWVLVGLMVACLVLEVVKYAVGNWTTAVTTFSVTLDLVIGAFMAVLVDTQQLANPELFVRADDPAAAATTTESIVLLVTLAVVAISIWDAVAGHLAYRRRAAG